MIYCLDLDLLLDLLLDLRLDLQLPLLRFNLPDDLFEINLYKLQPHLHLDLRALRPFLVVVTHVSEGLHVTFFLHVRQRN